MDIISINDFPITKHNLEFISFCLDNYLLNITGIKKVKSILEIELQSPRNELSRELVPEVQALVTRFRSQYTAGRKRRI